MKSNHAFAIEYTVRLLRINHPPSRAVREEQKHLRPAEPGRVKELRDYLDILGDFLRPEGDMHYA